MSPVKFIESDWDVAKRHHRSLFANRVTPYTLQKHLEIYESIGIINVVRDRESVLKSSNGWVTPKRYDECHRHAKKYKHLIDYTIEYKSLLEDPNKQQEIVASIFNLEPIHPWSDYPKFIDLSLEPTKLQKGNYQLRPIGQNPGRTPN